MSVAYLDLKTGEDEFPLLATAGLYVKETAGNGNCLFNALSDQLFGDQSKHAELRSTVINYMRDNGAYYKQFIEVHPGGGTRRNPKRKNAKGFSTPFSSVPATAEEVDRTFEGHLRQMARGGTYGDNMEIVAFSSALHVDVKIYQRDFAFVVAAKVANGVVAPVVHIAYHTWEHYSSIRNVAGPHIGLPEIKSVAGYGATEACSPKAAADEPMDQSWNVDAVRKMVGAGGGSVGDMISLRDDEKSTTPSTQGSSSVERDLDSEDEAPIRGPNKRQDRRLSRATKIAKENEDRSHDLTYRPKSGYLATTEGPSSTAKSSRGVRTIIVDDSEEEDWRNDGSRKGSESTSFSTSASEISVASKPTSAGVRLKLSQPKKPVKTPASNSRERPAVGAKAKTSTYKGTARVCPHSSPTHRRLAQEKKRNYRSLQKPVVPENKVINAGPGTKPLMTTQGNERTPVIETQIKVLYI